MVEIAEEIIESLLTQNRNCGGFCKTPGMIALAVMVVKDTHIAARSELFKDHNGVRLYPVPNAMRGLVICEDVTIPVVTDNVMGVCCEPLQTNLGMFRRQDFK